MISAQLLAYVTGTVYEELLSRNEYLAAENPHPEIPDQRSAVTLKRRKATLAEIAHRLGRQPLEEVASTAQPDAILGWYRKLIANRFDGSRFRQRAGRRTSSKQVPRMNKTKRVLGSVGAFSPRSILRIGRFQRWFKFSKSEAQGNVRG